MRTSRLLLEIWRGTVTSTFFTPALRHWEREQHQRFTTSSSWRLCIYGSLDCTSRLANVLFPSSSVRDSSRFGEMISRYGEYRSTTTRWKRFFRADIPNTWHLGRDGHQTRTARRCDLFRRYRCGPTRAL